MPDKKRCTKCGEEKDASEFTNDSSNGDGLYPSCRVCKNNSRKAYRQTPGEKKRRREYMRGYVKSEYQREYQRNYQREYRKRKKIETQ